MTGKWCIVAALDAPKELVAQFNSALTQFWNGDKWMIGDRHDAKEYATKKEAEAVAVGIVLSSPSLAGWIVKVVPVGSVKSLEDSVEIRIAK